MEGQPERRASQLCDWYACVAAEPLKVPSCSVSTWPTAAVPVIVGAPVLAGATTGTVTTAVAADVPDAWPAPFVAVSTTRIVCPASPATTVYVDPVAPPMA